jgi:outer membrane protein TolC
MAANVTIELNQAEVDALRQILTRHAEYLDQFEKDLLTGIIAKLDHP